MQTFTFLRNFILLTLFCFLTSCISIDSCRKERTIKKGFAEALAYAQKNLAKKGVLIQQKNGYAYLKLDDNYIHELFSRLSSIDGYSKPPYFRRSDAPGAHISVVYEGEKVRLKERGKTFHFDLQDIRKIDTKKGISYILLQVSAPQLERLRESYGLKSKLNNHEFHITIARKNIK